MKRVSYITLFLLISFLINPSLILQAQQKDTSSNTQKPTFIPQFKNLNFEENYSALADKNLRNNFWTKIKYIPLYKQAYLTFGGEIRARMEIRDHLNYGNGTEDRGADFQQRSRIWMDYHLTKNTRIFTELQSGTSYGLEAPPSPLDKNQIEVHQAFAENSTTFSNGGNLDFRIGRQEISIGKARLFDTRNPPNNRHSFDAAKGSYTVNSWLFEAFGGMEVADKIGAFNDGWNKNYTFFAAHIAKKGISILPSATVDLLYIYTNRKSVPTQPFYGNRNTFSGHISGIKGGLNYDVEGVIQTGRGIQNQKINAWFIASETNYTFKSKVLPYIGYKLDIGSGDKDSTDNKNNSYDFLWSKGISFGSDLGYTNLMSFGPSAGVRLFKKVQVDFWTQWLWRNSLHDGLYKMSEAYQRVPSYGTARFVGFRNLLKIEYQANPYLLFGTYFNRTAKGRYLEENDHNRSLFYGIFYTVLRF